MSPHISSPTSVGLGMEGLILVVEFSTLTGQEEVAWLCAKGLPDGSDWNEAVKSALAVGRDSCKSKERCALCSERLHWLTTMECSGLVLPFVLAVKSPLADHHGATLHFGSKKVDTCNVPCQGTTMPHL